MGADSHDYKEDDQADLRDKHGDADMDAPYTLLQGSLAPRPQEAIRGCGFWNERLVV